MTMHSGNDELAILRNLITHDADCAIALHLSRSAHAHWSPQFIINFISSQWFVVEYGVDVFESEVRVRVSCHSAVQ